MLGARMNTLVPSRGVRSRDDNNTSLLATNHTHAFVTGGMIHNVILH